MRLTLLQKITGLVFLAVVLVGGCNYAANRYFLSNTLDDQNVKEVGARADLVSDQFEGLKKNLTANGFLMASNPEVARRMAEADTAWLQNYAKQVMAETGLESITISDREGKCIARGHSDKVGDSVAKQVNVQKALKGEVTVGVEQGTIVKFSLRAGYPVKRGDEIVGVITPGFTLSSDRFVDQIKKNLGLECTLFQNDTRISTTIMKDGKRAIGTKMDNPAVLEAVIQKGQRSLAKCHLGLAYNTAYWPIVDVNGKNAGMFFIGQPVLHRTCAGPDAPFSLGPPSSSAHHAHCGLFRLPRAGAAHSVHHRYARKAAARGPGRGAVVDSTTRRAPWPRPCAP
jgi:methyl-accepting chemotaxis protein